MSNGGRSDGHGELPFDPDEPEIASRPLHLRPAAIGLVFVGGALGTAARYGLAVLMPTRSQHWPVGTFVANVVGAFVLGLLLEYLARAGDDTGWRRRVRLLLGTGFCGGLTTYSTFAVEVDLLARDGASATGALYLVASIAAGLLAVAIGIAVATGHRRRRERIAS